MAADGGKGGRASLAPAIWQTALIALLLTGVDYAVRRDALTWAGARYLLVIPALFFLLFFVRKLVLLFGDSRAGGAAAWFAALSLGLVWGAQYVFYGVYREFLSARDMGVTLSNLDYWLEHGASLLSVSQLWPLPVYVLLFYGWLALARRAGTGGRTAGRLSALALAGLLGFVLAFNVVKKVEARPYLTPFLYTLDQARTLMKNKKAYLVSYQKQAAPERHVDAIPAFTRRGDFNLLFILHESLRRDHESLFGYARDTTPNQKRRFGKALLYPHAVSNSGVTRNSCHSIFTGMMPTADNDLFSSSLIWQYARAADLDTFYISSHWLEWQAMDDLLLDQRYVDYVNAPLHADPTLGRDDMATVAAFENWLDEKYTDLPFFGVLHFSGTHYPYLAGDKQRIWEPAKASFDPDKITETVNEYDNAIHYVDMAVERALKALDDAGLADKTIIISTSDHAEAFYEHKQFFHGKVFWQEGYGVPFFVFIPAGLGPKFSADEWQALSDNRQRVVSNLDVFPTVLDLLGIPAAKKLDGHSLLRPYPAGFATSRVEAGGYIAIDNASRIKTVVNNKERWLATVDLKTDPVEKHPDYTRIQQKMTLTDLLARAAQDTAETSE